MNKDRIKKLQALDRHEPIDYDDIVYDKQKILLDLYKDKDIFELLHNTELEKAGAVPEDYYNVNIFSFMKIPDVQSEVKNFICFEIDDKEEVKGNDVLILKYVMFRTVSHIDDVETPYGINRHDLMAMIIKERYQWSHILGMQLKKIYDSGKIAENGYYYRDMYFRQISPNGLQKGEMRNQLDRKRDLYK